MTVLFHTGFDLFGAANNAANDGPAQWAGLANQPSKPTMAATGTAGRNMVGVSTIERFKMGRGADRRNSLTVWNTATAISDGTSTVTFPIAPVVTLPAVGSTIVFGFRYKHRRIDPALAYQPAQYPLLMVNGQVMISLVRTTNRFFISAAATGAELVLIEGQEYYIELEIQRTGTSTTNSVRHRLIIDGQVLGNPVMGNVVNYTSFGFQAPAGNYIWNCESNYADVYVSNVLLGPQMVLSRQPSVVLVKNWTPSEGDNSLALITGANSNDDGKYIISPTLGTERDLYRLEFDVPVGFQTQAASLFVRGRRDDASTRRIKAAVLNQATGDELVPAASQSLVFPQNEFATNQMWYSGDPAVLTRNNMNNLAIALTSPLS